MSGEKIIYMCYFWGRAHSFGRRTGIDRLDYPWEAQ